MVFYKNGNQTLNLRKCYKSRKETQGHLDVYCVVESSHTGVLSLEEEGMLETRMRERKVHGCKGIAMPSEQPRRGWKYHSLGRLKQSGILDHFS